MEPEFTYSKEITMEKGVKKTSFYYSIPHRLDGPAKVKENGDEWWYKMGILHRDGDDPAVVRKEMKMWVKEGKCHRDNDLPAIILTRGDKHWYNDGVLHRENGPAMIGPDGSEEYWLNGVKQEK